MSLRTMKEARTKFDGLSTTQRFLLYLLADYANNEGHAWPSVLTLAQVMGVTKRSVQRNLRELEHRKLISVEYQKRKDRSYTSSHYRLHLVTSVSSPSDPSVICDQNSYLTSMEHSSSKNSGGPSVKLSDLDSEEEALKKGGTKLTDIDITSVNTGEKVETIWKSILSEKYGYQVGWTLKQISQGKKLVVKLGPDRVGEVLEAVLLDWASFTEKVKSATGQKQVPAKPHLGFVLAHAQVASEFLGGKQEYPEVMQPVASGEIEVDEIEATMSPEDVIKMLAED